MVPSLKREKTSCYVRMNCGLQGRPYHNVFFASTRLKKTPPKKNQDCLAEE